MSTERFDLKSVVEASALLNASLDLDFILGNLLLVAMSRLLVGRGLVLLSERESTSEFRVAAAKGGTAMAPGDITTLRVPADVAEGDAVPMVLREQGLVLLLPVRHQQRVVGLVALGAKATGQPFEPTEVAFARSLVGISAAAIHNAQVAGQLQRVNLDLAARLQELDTLLELAQAFSTALDREGALKLLGFTLMGQFLAERHAVLLCEDDEKLIVAASRGLEAEMDEAAMELLNVMEAPCQLTDPEEPLPDGVADLLRALDFVLALPLRTPDAPRGLLLLGPRITGRPYAPSDLSFLSALGALALTAIESAALVEARIEKERLEEELRLARSIQERLLPGELPLVPGLELDTLALASRHVAGDYFDVLEMDDTHLLVAIADVSGKGAPAALLMANLQAALHLLRQSLDPLAPDLAGATQRLNRVVCENTDPASFITFCWGVLDRHRFRYVNAGHNPPRLLHANGAVDRLDVGGLLLGVLPDAVYETGEVVLAPGNALVLYTDGVSEARNPDEEEYGEDRIDAFLARHRQHTAPELLTALRTDVNAFADGTPLADDVTVLIAKVED